jgi:hypothetical protein
MKIISVVILFINVHISFGQVNFEYLNGEWKECVEYPTTDTLKMKPIAVSDSICKCSYQTGYYVRHIVTRYNFTDSKNVEVYTSHGSFPVKNAPTVDSTHMTTTILTDTVINEVGEIIITQTKIEMPAMLGYTGTSSCLLEPSTYKIKRRKHLLLIDQGDRVLKFIVLKLTKSELIMISQN